MYSIEDVVTKFHVKRPAQIAIALAITGDPDDNIKGVVGWGEKKLISLFENVDESMTFKQTVDYIDAQLDEKKREEFFHSLSLTMLSNEIENVPDLRLGSGRTRWSSRSTDWRG